MLPKLFIGSSGEAKNAGLLKELQSALEQGLNAGTPTVKIVPWPSSPWKNLKVAVNTLLENLVDYSYAIFILSADDELSLRGTKQYSSRDNVIFEFGLFLAYLGPERTFLIGPKNCDKTILLKQVKTTKAHTTPPAELPLRILTDLGTVYREGDYTISNPGVSPAIKFHIQKVVAAIKKNEAESARLSVGKAGPALLQSINTARTKIAEDKKGDAYYSGQFSTHFRSIASIKAKATEKSVQEAVQDLLLYLERIPDLCDVGQLARDQHHSKGVNEVWVFADKPLEFRPGGQHSNASKALRKTIMDNLKKDVDYVYFVGPDFEKSHVDYLVGKSSRDRAKMLKRISVVKVDSHLFNTYFTLHFKNNETSPAAIYMSSVMRDRKDLLIQVSDDEHVQRIFERISILRGEIEHDHSPRIERYVLSK